MSKIFVIGENSRLTKSLFNVANLKLIIVPKSIYENWIATNNFNTIISDLNINKGDSLIINKAIIDTRKDVKEVNHVNYSFPKNIIISLEKEKLKIKVYTTGSFFENTKVDNVYLNSKRKLSNFIATSNFNYITASHLRFHTLFGYDLPPSNMFLGQIFKSLQSGENFEMSHGNQLRQYHHYDELSKLIFNVINSEDSYDRIIEFTGNEWLKLKDIATAIFKNFDCIEKLKIGTLKTSNEEIIEKSKYFKSSGYFEFSPAIDLIISYLENIKNN